MRTDTQSVRLDGSRADVFAFISDAENLPRWAVGFARAVSSDGDGWIVRTAHGTIRLRLAANAAAGTIDYYMAADGGPEAVAYSRVLAVGDGAEYVFTQVQPPGMPDAAFDGQVQALAEELVILRAIFRAQAACPA
jgi:hypothetical protein